MHGGETMGVGSGWSWGEAGPWLGRGRGSRGHRGEGGSAWRLLTGERARAQPAGHAASRVKRTLPSASESSGVGHRGHRILLIPRLL